MSRVSLLFQSLIDQQRYDDCLKLAEETLQNGGQTTHDMAKCYHAVAQCKLRLNDPIGAARAAELAAQLAEAAGVWDLLGTCLTDLAAVYGRLRRYQQEILVLNRYLALLPRLDAQRSHEGEVRYAMGLAALHVGVYEQAGSMVCAALDIALSRGEERLADQCRGVLRSARIRAGTLSGNEELFAASETYIAAHPHDQAARFRYWFDLAEYSRAAGRPAEAVCHANKAMEFAGGKVAYEFDCCMLLGQCALQNGDYQDAARFVVGARICALEGGRHDLGCDAVTALLGLLEERGTEPLSGLDQDFARHGLQLFHYIPEALLAAG